MPMIEIPCIDLRYRPPHERRVCVDAEIIGCFAVHRTWYGPPVQDKILTDDYTLTHLPTGHYVVRSVTLAQARAGADELNASPNHWATLTDKAHMTDAQKHEGRLYRARIANGS
jgi:hypothetical protein